VGVAEQVSHYAPVVLSSKKEYNMHIVYQNTHAQNPHTSPSSWSSPLLRMFRIHGTQRD